MPNPNPVVFYTDGSCAPSNPGPGGWAYIRIANDSEDVGHGYSEYSTNNRMELTAAIEALRTEPDGSNIVVFTDSEYVKLGITSWIHAWKRNNWRRNKKPVKNQDLWQALDEQNSRLSVEWRWVRAHEGNVLNERVDSIARKAALTGVGV